MGNEIESAVNYATDAAVEGAEAVFGGIGTVVEGTVDALEYDYNPEFDYDGYGRWRRLSNGEKWAASTVQSNLGRGRGGD